MSELRPAAVAGMFYPGDAAALSQTVNSLLARATDPVRPPKALVVPHAGYIYSGAVAARAFHHLEPLRDTIKRVVLIGPAHRMAVDGIAVSTAAAFETPLGRVPVDRDGVADALTMPHCHAHDHAHAPEHCLEVELPFLQTCLTEFSIIPLLVGRSAPATIAALLERLWGGPETLIVISTDLSHYLDYDTARTLDARTCRAVESLDIEAIGHDQACGRLPLAGLMTVLRRQGARLHTLALCNSGDTAGDRRRVVGYGAWMATAETGASLGTRHGAALLRLAARSIRHGLAQGAPLRPEPADWPQELREAGACFVTLKRAGRLRGCIGSPVAWRPLVEDVAENAYKAAFNDGRFFPLVVGEVDADLDLSLSLLTPPETFRFSSEADLIARLVPGRDGLILQDGDHRGLFLPSVWEELPDPTQFLIQLKRKAGLAADYWSKDMRAQRFFAEQVGSGVVGGPAALWSQNRDRDGVLTTRM